MADDWDTSGQDEASADPYNKTQFAGGSSGEQGSASGTPAASSSTGESAAPVPAPAAESASEVEQVSAGVSEMAVAESVEEAAKAAPAPLEVKAPAAAPASSSSTPPRSPGTGGSGKRPSLAPADAPAFLKEDHSSGTAFTEKLSPDALAFFNELCEKTFAEQAVAFLNAYWQEVGSQAEFIFEVAYDMIQYADMHAKGVNYVHLYEEGNDLDFNIGLYFYEKLCKKVLDDDAGKKWRDDPKFAPSMPTMMTAIKRKIELREKVDVNFDGRIGMLEYLLYQYQDFANPADFTFRAMKTADVEEHPEIVKAREALAEVNRAIQAYEAEKHRLTELAAKPGVKGLGAKHSLAILESSPLAEQLNQKLITAEAAVRIATRKFGDGKVPVSSGGEQVEHRKPTAGSVWWLNAEIEYKKKLYGRRGK